jgi:hypothetical protein
MLKQVVHIVTIALQWEETRFAVDKKYNNDSTVAWVRKRTITTERPPLVGEVSANFCW